jgi:hypothetical protein
MVSTFGFCGMQSPTIVNTALELSRYSESFEHEDFQNRYAFVNKPASKD